MKLYFRALRLFLAAALVILMPALSFAEANQLPPAPAGYEWYVSKNGVGTFLKPNTWFVKEEIAKDTHALFITKRDFTASGIFDIGFSVNQINDFSKKHSTAPSLYAAKYIKKLTEQKEVIKSDIIENNKNNMYVAQVRISNNGTTTVVHYITIGDDEKDTLYVLFFEAPEKNWAEEIKTAEPMLNMFGLGR